MSELGVAQDGFFGCGAAAVHGQVLRFRLLGRHHGALEQAAVVVVARGLVQEVVVVAVGEARGAGAAMVRQVVAAPESASADATLEGLLSAVDEGVGLELVRVGEARWAHVARVRPLSRVHAEVAPKVRHLHELALAMRTVVRLLARVQTHVRL